MHWKILAGKCTNCALEQDKNPLQWVIELSQFLLWWKVALPRILTINGA